LPAGNIVGALHHKL